VEQNNLYPIFLKTQEINLLIVGGGNVALEKLHFLLKSSPKAKVTMVAPFFKEETNTLAQEYNVCMVKAPYARVFLKSKHLVIAATNNLEVNEQVYNDAKKQNLLVNVADTPALCDFYMGGIVTKGNVKVAISTNGKSPTMAKRLRQFFEEVIPNDINLLVENLHSYRNTLKGDFQEKVNTLNKVTSTLIQK
jgi:precorrin-2 dehydrogenase/sirohydrochlorin ferrochelatase